MKRGNDAKNRVSWCLKQKKGIRFEDPNDNLCKAFIKKARGSLNMLESAIRKKEVEWIAATAYYARYFAFYALLQACGIRSEIHDCTISLMRFLFVEESLVAEELHTELLRAKSLRVDTQYYVFSEADFEKLKKDALGSGSFVLSHGKIAGDAVYRHLDKDRIEIKNFRIDKNYRRRDLGHFLLSQIEFENSGRNLVLDVTTKNFLGVEFFIRNMFRITAREELYREGQFEYLMEKQA